ncbi:MAG: hypothetical protein DRP56_00165 [Planctomycetota bacterium]|nr:MAG: hypothetical protein DRP56_00165 [Planctomycetota bacterium]RKY13610.1 MAG: hypothetical protein DRP52_02320 [Planctomycetota bacterium]
MGRPKRITLGGYVYHVLNRANGRLRIFKKDSDFAAFEKILIEGIKRFEIRLCGYCLMGNHWHRPFTQLNEHSQKFTTHNLRQRLPKPLRCFIR